jgi:hypothetical protein
MHTSVNQTANCSKKNYNLLHRQINIFPTLYFSYVEIQGGMEEQNKRTWEYLDTQLFAPHK